ncbi:MAG: DUF4337 family protein [Acidimicrobiia bacterium]
MESFGESGEIAAELALDEVGDGAPPWFQGVALTTLVLSVLTAAAALLAGMTAHETLLDRTEEILVISSANSDLTSAQILSAKHDIQTALDVPLDPDEVALVEEYEAEAAELAAEAEAAESAALEAASTHLIAAIAATFFAVAIAVTGLAAVVRRRWLWFTGIGLGAVSCIPFGVAIVQFVA